MPEPTPEELTESIQLLRSYRDRLHREVSSISDKLRIPQEKKNSSLKNHAELNKLENMIKKLIEQRDNKVKSIK